jgi:hypothetical protein
MKDFSLTSGASITIPDNSAGQAVNSLPVFKLNFDLSGVDSTATMSNQLALERTAQLANNGYYFTMQPKTSRNGESYMWIIATKRGEDREEFSLRANNEVLGIIIAVLVGKSINISGINADDLTDFNKNVKNFELELYMNEKEQGRTMKRTYSPTGQTLSSYYKKGVIVYKPYLNPEFKAYINA